MVSQVDDLLMSAIQALDGSEEAEMVDPTVAAEFVPDTGVARRMIGRHERYRPRPSGEIGDGLGQDLPASLVRLKVRPLHVVSRELTPVAGGLAVTTEPLRGTGVGVE